MKGAATLTPEALALRTALGQLTLLHDALAADADHAREDEDYTLDAGRITAMYGLLDGALPALRSVRLEEASRG